MAILKEGSAGDEVRDMQMRLNELGAAPRLVVDGQFGPATRSALSAFQERANLRRHDGDLDPMTQAALKFGGTLPEMRVMDYAQLPDVFETIPDNFARLLEHLNRMKSLITRLDAQVSKNRAAVQAMMDRNRPIWGDLAHRYEVISHLQKEFREVLLDDPHRAEQIAMECVKRNGEAQKLYNLAFELQSDTNDALKTLQVYSATMAKEMTRQADELAKLLKN